MPIFLPPSRLERVIHLKGEVVSILPLLVTCTALELIRPVSDIKIPTQVFLESNKHPALGIELCFLLKYVEFDVGSSSPALWCVRKMAVYQKVNMRSQETKCILIQPSADVQRRKEEVSQSTEACGDLSEHWTSLHLLLLGTLTRNWTTYLKYLDISVEHLVSRTSYFL